MAAILISVRLLNLAIELPIANLIKELRKRRYLSCQTPHQYLFVHRALIAYITAKQVRKFLAFFSR